MTEQILLFSISLLVILVLGLFLGARIASSSLKSAAKLKDEERLKRNKTYKEALRVLENARGKSLKILQDSTKQANKAIREAESIADDTRSLLEETLKATTIKQAANLKQVTQELLNRNKEIIERGQLASVSSLEELTKEVEGEVIKEIDAFKDNLHKEIIESEQLVEERVHSEYEVLRNELKNYKESRLKEIDREIANIVLKVSKEVLGKAIDLKDHEDLVIRALEKAKKEGVFG